MPRVEQCHVAGCCAALMGHRRIGCCLEHQFTALRARLLTAASMHTALASDASAALPAL
ncbi:hypothetical protein XCV3422 [Xanthomonas euvesicatoria pv. vesicatoria str. 85-10]|uniref:Uncharacterized protein n=1 Tax=Xanthomonas euvesicatoria pv. vesicatoria (strain 85-10) TaxID=316273 RepID=Q3BQ10_XANE5|nr:hypothetical protein XCV3422 [Xanthomonas euvesicatoria pv. vesicatoria str. 85-10]